MPLKGLLYGEAPARFTRVHAKEFAGSPVGQIAGSLDKARPARVVLDMVDGWIEATQRMCDLLSEAHRGAALRCVAAENGYRRA